MKWISAKYELPEKGEDVLVVNENGQRFVSYLTTGHDSLFDVWTISTIGAPMVYPITHWTPLPEPPGNV